MQHCDLTKSNQGNLSFPHLPFGVRRVSVRSAKFSLVLHSRFSPITLKRRPVMHSSSVTCAASLVCFSSLSLYDMLSFSQGDRFYSHVSLFNRLNKQNFTNLQFSFLEHLPEQALHASFYPFKQSGLCCAFYYIIGTNSIQFYKVWDQVGSAKKLGTKFVQLEKVKGSMGTSAFFIFASNGVVG